MRETKQIYTHIPERIIQQKFFSYQKLSHKIYWNIVGLYARFVSSSKSHWHCNDFPRWYSTRSLNQSNTFLHLHSYANHIHKHISRNARHLWKIFLIYIFQLYLDILFFRDIISNHRPDYCGLFKIGLFSFNIVWRNILVIFTLSRLVGFKNFDNSFNGLL